MTPGATEFVPPNPTGDGQFATDGGSHASPISSVTIAGITINGGGGDCKCVNTGNCCFRFYVEYDRFIIECFPCSAWSFYCTGNECN